MLVCPAAIVNAPAEKVWGVLTNPADWGNFFDLRVKKVEPQGPAKVGTIVYAETSFVNLKVTLEFKEINIPKGRLGIYVKLPFWQFNDELIEITPLTDKTCRVQYNCNLSNKHKLLGSVMFFVLKSKYEHDPADSLARLKRYAES